MDRWTMDNGQYSPKIWTMDRWIDRSHITDNGNKRLPGQNCCVWHPGAKNLPKVVEKRNG